MLIGVGFLIFITVLFVIMTLVNKNNRMLKEMHEEVSWMTARLERRKTEK